MSRMVAVAIALLAWVTCAAAQPQYTVTPLGDFHVESLNPGGVGDFHAESLDPRGVVVGALYLPNGESRPALWEQGTVTILPIDGFALARNAAGQTVGGAYQTSQPFTVPLEWTGDHYALWPVPPGTFSGQANAINDLGMGVCAFGDGRVLMPARCDATGFALLSTLGGDTFPAAINAQGIVAGAGETLDGAGHILVWDAQNHLYDYGNLGGELAKLYGFNDAGQFAGSSSTISGEVRAFGGDLQQGLVPLTHPSGFDQAQAFGLNNQGVRVGMGQVDEQRTQMTLALRWDADGSVHDLNDFIDPQAGWTLLAATAINDAGQILAKAFGGVVLLTPIPSEPPALADPSQSGDVPPR
jgi:uncharacterized membrane protein